MPNGKFYQLKKYLSEKYLFDITTDFKLITHRKWFKYILTPSLENTTISTGSRELFLSTE